MWVYGDVDSDAQDCVTTISLGEEGWTGLNGRVSSVHVTLEPWGETQTIDFCQNAFGLPSVARYPEVLSAGSGRDVSEVGNLYVNGYLFGVHDLRRNFQYLHSAEYDPHGAVTAFKRGNKGRTTIERDVQGRPYEFEVWVRMAKFQKAKEGAGIMLHWLEAADLPANLRNNVAIRTDSLIQRRPSGAKWHRLEGTFTAPARAKVVRILILADVFSNSSSGVAWFDDLSFRLKL